MIDQIIATSAKDLHLQTLVIYSFSETEVLSGSKEVHQLSKEYLKLKLSNH